MKLNAKSVFLILCGSLKIPDYKRTYSNFYHSIKQLYLRMENKSKNDFFNFANLVVSVVHT
jgi:hypothetical protein